MKSLLLIGLLFSLPVFAAEKTISLPVKKMEALKIKQGTAIEIDTYDVSTDTFEVVIVNELGVGPNVVSTEDLVHSIGTGVSIEEFRKNKKDYQGSEFTTKSSLPLLSIEQIAARKNKRK